MNKPTSSKRTKHNLKKRIGNALRDEDRILFIGLTVLITLFVAAVVVYATGNSSKIVTRFISTSDAPVKVLKSQEIAKSHSYTISISNVTENSKFDPAFPIADTDTMLIAEISITNTSAKEQDILPSVQFYVRSSDGLYYEMHPSMYATKPLQAGKLGVGETTKGEITFAIPKVLTHPYLYLDLGWDNYIPVVYDVLH